MFEDYKIVWRLRKGDTTALHEVYNKYRDTLYTMALALVNDYAAAEDVLYDVFLTFAQKAPSFHISGSLKNYLAGCVIERCRKMLRSSMYKVVEVQRPKRWSMRENESGQDAADNGPDAVLMEAMSKVPLPQREAVVLYINGGLKFREIAQVLNVSLNTVQSRYRYGMEKLSSILDGQIE